MFQTPVFIPSRSRASRLNKSVLTKLPPEIQKQAVLIVPDIQFEEYDKIRKKDFPNVGIWGTNAEGISKTRKFIGEFTKNWMKSSKFIMLDDDLTDWATRIGPDTHKLRQSTPDDMIEMFEWIQNTLDTYAHCSVSPRGNNMVRNNKGVFVGEKPLTMENVRTLRLLAYRVEEFLSVEHGRVPIMEDFDVNLQLLEKGYKNIQSYNWTQDQRQTALPGGCSDYRTLELHDAGARRLAELHPNFVKLRTKVNKAKVTHNQAFTERTEVTIAWKEAYKSSQEPRDEMEKPSSRNTASKIKVSG